MKLVKSNWQIIEPTGYTIDDIYKSIELAGRVSHKSEDKITEDSAKSFVGRMLNMKHLATCEFGTVYLEIPRDKFEEIPDYIDKYIYNKYSRVTVSEVDYGITTNYRVLVENNWLDDLKYLSDSNYKEKRYTVKFICDKGILAEFTRHRNFSFMAESSRYNNYSKNKFGNELTFIKPCWTNIPEGDYGDIFNPKEPDITLTPNEYAFIDSLREAEKHYIELTNNGWKAEQARNVLPLALKTELFMCGYAEDWEKFFELRSKKYGIGNPHPQSDELATPLYEEFIKRKYINE